MPDMSVTEETFQADMVPLNAEAVRNIKCMWVTPDVSQPGRSWLNEVAP